MSETPSTHTIPASSGSTSIERWSAGPVNPFTLFREEEIEQSIPRRFEEQAARYAQRIAVKGRKHTFTYEALNRYANRVARAILAAQSGDATTVGLFLEKDAPMMAALLGVLKAGKIYIALDPTQPLERAAKMLEDAGAKLLLTDEENSAAARELAQGTRKVLNIAGIDPALPGDNLNMAIAPDSLAYIIYTSGSTGEPKGVAQNHRNVLHNIRKHTNSLHICAEDRLSLLASCSTAQAGTDIYSALLNGATLCPFGIKEEGLVRLAGWLREEQITIYHSSASIYRYLLGAMDERENYPALRLIKLGSEQVFKSDVEQYQKRFSAECIFVNALSSSEAGTLRQIFVDKGTRLHQNVVPVGFPVDGMEILLRDEAGQTPDSNAHGEIVIKSRYLAPGYWGRPDLTGELFHADPADGRVRLFYTGDLGRMRPDGCMEYLGRKDFQVKIRGFRVEIAEVEAALLTAGNVKQAAVAVQEDSRGENNLVAYVVAGESSALSLHELRSHLRTRIPEHMVPAKFIRLEALPLTASGKLERASLEFQRPLEAADGRDLGPANGVAEYALELQIQKIWEELLGVQRVGTQDDFFALGGHSLLAVRMLDRVEAVCGTKLPLKTLLAGATVKHLANSILRANHENFRSPVVAVQPEGSRTPFFFLHGDFNGGGFYCRNLARLLGKDQPFYALQPHGLDGQAVPATIEAMAADRVEALRKVRPAGPYLLGGHCNGGLVAFEMARQLRAGGARVDLVVVIDAAASNVRYRRAKRAVTFFGSLFFKNGQKKREWFRKLRAGLMGLENSIRQHAHPVPEYVASPRQLEYRAAIEGYVPERYDGRVAFLRSRSMESRVPGNETAYWAEVAAHVDVHAIPGEHLTCLTEHVEALAEHLDMCLRGAAQGTGKQQAIASAFSEGKK